MCLELKFDPQNKEQFLIYVLQLTPFFIRNPFSPFFLLSFLCWYDKRYYNQFNMPLGISHDI